MACRWRARRACVSAAGGEAGRKNVLGFGVHGVVALYSVGSARVRIRSVAHRPADRSIVMGLMGRVVPGCVPSCRSG
jgi:hypothetical protein